MLADRIDQQALRAGDPALGPLRPQSLGNEIQAWTNRLIDVQPANGMAFQTEAVVAQQAVRIQSVGVFLPLLVLGFVKRAGLVLLEVLGLKLVELIALLVSASFDGLLVVTFRRLQRLLRH